MQGSWTWGGKRYRRLKVGELNFFSDDILTRSNAFIIFCHLGLVAVCAELFMMYLVCDSLLIFFCLFLHIMRLFVLLPLLGQYDQFFSFFLTLNFMLVHIIWFSTYVQLFSNVDVIEESFIIFFYFFFWISSWIHEFFW